MTKLNPLDIVDAPNQDAILGRSLVRWYSPVFGYVDMYINPETLNISESKSLTQTRTKAGFILQYAGENLTEISVSGTTGSSGVEGINVLHSVYRSEHIGFTGIADQLEQEYAQQIINNTAANVADAALSFVGADQQIIGAIGSSALNFSNQPFPSLASLAAAIELRFQGVTYRGYFTSFSFSEQAGSPGLFDYNISFTAYATLGQRHNFMPWHRQPVGPADSNRKDNFTFANGIQESQRIDLPPPEPIEKLPKRSPELTKSRQLSVTKTDLTTQIGFAPIRGVVERE